MSTYTRFRLQRTVRRNTRQLRSWWQTSSRYIRLNLFGKWRQLAMIRRFALVWWALIAACAIGLIIQLQGLESQAVVLQALPGGNYSEAVVGTVKNINPILPEGSASSDASHLIFSGLTRFDTEGNLEPDLATSWTASPDGKTYTFHLRHGVKWQDGVPFTSQDVVFTLTAIQNPDTRSPLGPSWQGVHVSAPNAYTVTYVLPKPYAPFLNATTVGILPAHLLDNTDPASLQVSTFNQNPVGTGPFKIDQFDVAGGEISFKPNTAYYLGKPLLASVTLRLYDTAAEAFTAYIHRQVQGVAMLQPNQVAAARNLGTMKVYDVAVPDEVAVFLQTSTPILQDSAVRTALAEATNRSAIIRTQLDNQATTLTGPLLPSKSLTGTPHQPNFNLSQANAALTADGWKISSDGVRVKNGQRLELKLVTQSDSVYTGVADQLAQQWGKLGVRLDITAVDSSNLQESYIRTRHYDALLYGINTGADPDVYSYWDSSQVKDPGQNLSDYNSSAADKALEAGRVISNPDLRAAKYRSFVETWVGDTPAVMLYTPTYEYGVDASVHGVDVHKLIDPSDRFADIQQWSVVERKVTGP